MKTQVYQNGQLVEQDWNDADWEEAWRNWVRLRCRMSEPPSDEDLELVKRIHEGSE